MKNTQSMKRNNDFRRLYSSGKSFAGAYTVIYYRNNKRDYNRMGLTVSKSAGKAVTRNRQKRLMRESYRLIEDNIRKGIDIVIVSRNRAIGKKRQQITKDMEYCLSKLGLLSR